MCSSDLKKVKSADLGKIMWKPGLLSDIISIEMIIVYAVRCDGLSG